MRVIKNIIGAIFISIAGLIFWVFILPGYEMQAYLKSSLEVRLVAFDTKTQLIQKVSDINKEYENKFNELKRLSLVVPSEKNIAEVITSIEAMSSQSGSHLAELTVTEGTDFGEIKDYNTMFADISLSGSYESLLIFMDRLEKYLRLIDTISFSVDIKEDETTESQIVLLTKIRASIYYLKPITEKRITDGVQINPTE